MKIKKVALTDIRPYWRNPRDNEKAVEAVKQSITEYGFNSPLVLDPEMVIIAGHTRYKALMQLGWTHADCVVVDLPADKAKAYRIADNKTSEMAEWDMDKLIPELREIEQIAGMQIFFPEVNLDSLLQDTGGAINFTLPTEEKIAKVETALETQFTDRSEQQKAAYVEVSCPHCGEKSFVDRDELLRQRTTEM